MKIVAHSGPNWTRDSLATSPQHVAIAVRNTVLIYSHDTTFETELRATGSPARIASLSFCRAACLTSLLVVASQSGHVRIFDVDARRIFRVLADGGSPCFAVRFLENMPHRVLVVSDLLSVFEIVKHPRVVHKRKSPFEHVVLVELIPNLSSHVLMAGKREDDICLCVVNLYEEQDVNVLIKGFAVHDVAIRHRPNHIHPFVMAVTAVKFSYPMFFVSEDGVQWTKLPDVKPHVPRQFCTADNYDKQKKLQSSKLLRTAVCWAADQILYTTNTRGTLYAWKVNDACQMHFFTQRQYAHRRQIFAIKCVANKTIFSISMDRTLAKWSITEVAQPCLALRWRSLPTQAPVTALSMSNPRQTANECFFSFTTGTNSLSCVKWTAREHQFSLVAEASPADLVLGKRKRETVSYLTTPDQLFDESFSMMKVESQTLFVFGFSEGRKGTFTIADGKVVVSPLQSDRSATLRQALVADTISEHKKKPESTNKISVPSAMSERRKKRELRKNTSVPLSMLDNVLVDDKVTGACMFQAQGHLGEQQVCFLLGSERGSLYFFSKEQGVKLISKSLPISSICSIEYEPVSSLVSVSDANGVLLTLKWSKTESSVQDVGRSVNRYDLSSAICFVRWSQPLTDEQNTISVTYLLLALQNGETFVWSSDTDGRLAPRAQIREHRGRVCDAVLFENKYILTAGEDGTVRFWDIDRLPRCK